MYERAAPNNFSIGVGASKDVCLLLWTEISFQATSWQSGRSRDTRLIRQLEFTTASKRASLNSVQMPEITSGLIAHPSLARPSPSEVYFVAMALHTKKLV